MPHHQPPTSGRYQLVDALNVEWARLVEEHPSAVRRWSLEHRALHGCTELPDLIQAIRLTPDDALHALLSECLAGDELAGRVVLQSMLGKIVRMVSRDKHATSDDYVTAMWCRIRTYPLTARPRRVAANLYLDTLKAVTQDLADSAACLPMAPGGCFDWLCGRVHAAQLLDHNLVESWTGRRLISAAAELGLIDQNTEAVMRSVYLDGMSSHQAAMRHRISAANVRYRCSRAVRRLSENSEILLEVA